MEKPFQERTYESTHCSLRQDFRDIHWLGLLMVFDLCAAHLDAGEQLLSGGVQELAAAAVLVYGGRDRNHAFRECLAP